MATRDVQKPNGIIVTPDGKTVYVADNSRSAGGQTSTAGVHGAIGRNLVSKRVPCDFGPKRGGIDGMTLDRQGNLYTTAGSGAEAGIYVFGSQGQQLAFIATPGSPSNCVCGIGKESSTLYITGGGPEATTQNRARMSAPTRYIGCR